MRSIKVKELTMENFAAYGSFYDVGKPSGLGGGIPGMTFYPDRVFVELGDAHAAALSVTKVNKALPKVILALEQHKHTGEGMLSMDGNMVLYVAPAGLGYPQNLENVEAFVIPKNVAVAIRPGVWHCMPFVVDTEEINVLNILPERTYANDTDMNVLKEEERIAIEL